MSPLSFVDVPDRAYIDGMLGVYELNRIELLRVVVTEIMSLHEGNIARYHLRPSEYNAWRKDWK